MSKSVRWLSFELIESDERHLFRLPCPAGALVQLAASDQGNRRLTARVLRLNPAILLLSLAGFRNQNSRSPRSGTELLTWCEAHLIQSLANGLDGRLDDEPGIVSGDLSRFTAKKQIAFFETHLRARNNIKLRKSLFQFLKQVSPQPLIDKKRLNRMVGKKIRADELKCKRIRRGKTLDQVIDRWQTRIAPEIDVPNVIRMAADFQTLQTQFDARLMDEKMAAMKQLAYGASHEINNPLANISTRAQTLLAIEESPDKRYKLSVIYEQAIRAHDMISDMMLFAHPPVIERVDVSVRLLMVKIVNEMASLFDSNPGIDLVVTVGPGVDQVNVDPVHISVVIKNLVRNSVEAIGSTPGALKDSRGRIEIRIAQNSNGATEISVWDNGIGITPDVARHLFDPFYSSREAGRGLGFGLSKSWTIAKLHGGELRWDDQNGTGTRFLLVIPQEINENRPGFLPGLTICPKPKALKEEAA